MKLRQMLTTDYAVDPVKVAALIGAALIVIGILMNIFYC